MTGYKFRINCVIYFLSPILAYHGYKLDKCFMAMIKYFSVYFYKYEIIVNNTTHLKVAEVETIN